ncbi:hypothetical protein ACD661_06455 [Legionella lytica]|uniref:SidC N-terminal domain-containing protein n=1 Tax=Legionella lytica TaxID=96232 RepID=A0ABW8D677_9GAMM
MTKYHIQAIFSHKKFILSTLWFTIAFYCAIKDLNTNLMLISLKEPPSPRYIHINPTTNQIHLLVPIVGGQEISTDNTCQATAALRKFFDGGALNELIMYQNALTFDIGLLTHDNPLRIAKEERLTQINVYIEAVRAMRYSYGHALNTFLAKPSNLYSIQLRPREQDSESRVINPVFSVVRQNDNSGRPLSALYNAMYQVFPATTITPCTPQSSLSTAVLNNLSPSPTFEEIVKVLTAQCKKTFSMEIDFTSYFNLINNQVIKQTVNQAYIDALMGYDEDPATPEEYIQTLLGTCAPNLWGTIPTLMSPFYSLPPTTSVEEKTEQLSIITQFYLANLNIYCKAKGISTQNFGAILDASPALSHDLTQTIATALSLGNQIEQTICAFYTHHAPQFELSRPFTPTDITLVQQQFERTYRTITATKDNPHMDDFMILDREATGAHFVTHQGSICVNFAEVVTLEAANQNYFARIRTDFLEHPVEISNKNEGIVATVNIELETLLTQVNDEQFQLLPQEVKDACHALPDFQMRQFLHDVAKGRQTEAENSLTPMQNNTQMLLQTPGLFTDYSGRTFYCTAYEYAYWAKDTQMRRMLEAHMDDETKTLLLARIERIEQHGLAYQQRGQNFQSKHFDMTPLIKSIEEYIRGWNNWLREGNTNASHVARMKIGKAQREVPAHVAHEYCRPDKSFETRRDFRETTLPRGLNYDNLGQCWFPLKSSSAGLGFDFAFIRGGMPGVRSMWAGIPPCLIDLGAMYELDEVRTAELAQSRENLSERTNRVAICLIG